ncbi:MAG: UvrB/UvrC motif-containing protein [Puniceicoccales bacterium]|jgi:protein arginine kinase activator|nr:UvrB/UvrC motif-containing protein [Puniceicoccales bacterium]
MELLKCSICGNPAAVHIEQVVQGMKQSISLCEACARGYGVLTSNMVPFSVAQNIGTALFGDLSLSLVSQGSCQRCGYTVELFKKMGYLGCAQCYEHLGKQLLPLIENMQKSLQHVGKRPKGFVVCEEKNLTKESLEEKLQQAIVAEQFEEAARIRDQLRVLQNEND